MDDDGLEYETAASIAALGPPPSKTSDDVATSEGERLFMSKFKWWPLDTSSEEATVDLRDKNGHTVLQVAQRQGHAEIAKLIRRNKNQKGAAADSKEKQGKTGNQIRRKASKGNDGSQKEVHVDEQEDAKRTEVRAEPEKKKTEMVATVAVEAALKKSFEDVSTDKRARAISEKNDNGLEDECFHFL
jgi:hypothetical protein